MHSPFLDIVLAFVIITPPERSATPFCAAVLRAESSKSIPSNDNFFLVRFLSNSRSDFIFSINRFHCLPQAIKSLDSLKVSDFSPCVDRKYGMTNPVYLSVIYIVLIKPSMALSKSASFLDHAY